MRISPNSEVASPPEAQGRTPAREVVIGQDDLSLSKTDSLDSALRQTPDSRADTVANASALLNDATYPPLVLIHKLSSLLAIHLDVSSQNSDQ